MISSSSAFRIRPSVLFSSKINLNYESCSQLVGLPTARTLLTQDNTNTEETRTDIHASSGIRTHDPSVRAGEDISRLRLRGGHCDRHNDL
jgi:hypothetical protein